MAAERRWSNGQNGGRANPWRTSPWSPPEPTHERRRSCEQVACACDPNKAKSEIGPRTAANICTNLAILVPTSKFLAFVKNTFHIVLWSFLDNLDWASCKKNISSKRVLSISLTSSWQNCNLTKDFTFIYLTTCFDDWRPVHVVVFNI